MDRDEIEEKYGWKEGEREAMLRDNAERARRIRSAENLAWCEARKAARAEAETETDTEQPAMMERTMQRPAAMTDDWVRYIKSQLDKRTATMSGAFGEVLGRVEKRHKDALGDLRTELAALRTEIAELRAEMKVHSSLDDLQARLDKLETATNERSPFRAVG